MTYSLERYAGAIQSAGLTVTGTEMILGREHITAELKIGDRLLSIICDEKGTARIDKPNNTKKWVYEKTYAQIGAVLRQTINFYKIGK